MKNKRLEIYTIDSDYIEYLSKVDGNVMVNQKNKKSRKRPYVGVVIEIDGFLYFAPLTHDGKKWIGYKDHIILDKGNLGAIKIGRMVPIYKDFKQTLLTIIIRSRYINSPIKQDKQYGALLQKQYRYLNHYLNGENFYKRILNFYKRNIKYRFTCDFKRLETAAYLWKYKYQQLYKLIILYKNTENKLYY